MHARRLLGVTTALALWLASSAVQAQFRRADATVTAPPVSVAAPQGPVAVDVDPAALAFLDAWGLTYVHADAQQGDALLERGDSVYLGAPLPFGLAVGASAHSVRPSESLRAADRGVFGLSLAGAPSRKFGLGATLRYYASESDALDGLTSLDLAMNVRPSSRWAMSVLARDLNGLVDLTGVDQELPSTFMLASAFRPYGSDSLTFEAAGAVDTDGRLGARATARVAIPHVGYATAVAEVDDILGEGSELLGEGPNLRVVAGLQANWSLLGAGGGVIAGDGFGNTPGWYVQASLRGAQRRGLPDPSHVLNVEVRSELDARRMLRVTRRLERAIHDDRVAGVLVRLRSTDMGLAYAQELRLLLQTLEEQGKPVVCHLAGASGSEYYACAGASRRLLDPAGGIRLTGPSSDVLLLGELLQKVGLRADFVRIGKYKSAVEQLSNRKSSEPARRQRNVLLDDVYERLVADLAGDLDTGRAQARQVIDRGPYTAPEALEADLAQKTADELVLDRKVSEFFGPGANLRDHMPKQADRHWGVPPRVGVVVVDGNIVDGKNVDLPIVDIHASGGRTVSKALGRMARDPSVRAIVLRVDSPGGSALASDQIWRAVRRARKRKPVVASMGAVAASGGYYVASAADEIWASPSTVTGSIGIFFGKVDLAPLADWAGVTVEQMTRGRHAGSGSLWRPYTPEERAMLADKIRHWYGLFLRRVAKGRGMNVEQVDAVARGRIWSGDAALRKGLVDRLGGFASALARARQLGGLAPDAEVTIVPDRPDTLLEYVLGTGFGARAEGSEQEKAPAGGLGSLAPAAGMALTLGRSDTGVPLALMPAVVSLQ